MSPASSPPAPTRHRKDPTPGLTRALAAVPDTALDDATPAERARDRRQRVIGVVLLVLVVAALAGVLALTTRGTASEERAAVAEVQLDETAAVAVSLAEQISAECDAGRLAGAVCAQADDVVADPIPDVIATGPTPEEIRQAVADYFAANPLPGGRAPTTAEIAAVVADYLIANPPMPGRPPTSTEISDAVAAYFAVNPPPAGRAPTEEEIAAAVAAYLRANPPERGAQGVGVQEVRAEQRGEECALVFVLRDPADGTTTEQVVPVSSRVCDEGLIS